MPEENLMPPEPEAPYVDPVVRHLSGLKFETDLFDVLHQSNSDPDLYSKFFNVPELYVLMNALYVIDQHDPNKHIEEGHMDHYAMANLIRWITIKFATDPVWMCYFGWFIRFMAAHTSPTSYWPIKFSPRWLPENFIKRGEEIDIRTENAKLKTPEEIFKRRKSK